MTDRELERRYIEMKLTYKNLVNANVELLDENKMLKEEKERLREELKREKAVFIRKYRTFLEVLEDLKNGSDKE